MRIALVVGLMGFLASCAGDTTGEDSGLPFYDFAIRYLGSHRADATLLAQELSREPVIDFVAYNTTDGVIARSPTEFRVPLDERAQEKYKFLFDEADVYYVAKHHSFTGHVFLELGTDDAYDRVFGALLVYGPGLPTESCQGQYRMTEVGHCNFDLGFDWYIHYGWSLE